MRINKFLIGGLIGVHASSIVNEAIETISSQFFIFYYYYFLRKDFEQKKSTKTQNKRFPPSWKFLCVQKTIAFVVLCSLIFVFVGWFWLICTFVCSKSFHKKNTNWLEIVLIASFTILLIFCDWSQNIAFFQKRHLCSSSHASFLCENSTQCYTILWVITQLFSKLK